MVQLKHNLQTINGLLELHREIIEKLEGFKKNHPQLVYDITLLIGEKSHIIKIDLDLIDAEGTGTSTEGTGEEI